MDSGTEHFPEGFFSQRRRSLWRRAPSVTGGATSAGGAGCLTGSLSGEGAVIFGGGVLKGFLELEL